MFVDVQLGFRIEQFTEHGGSLRHCRLSLRERTSFRGAKGDNACSPYSAPLSPLQRPIVAFRSAKGRPFAERKATIACSPYSAPLSPLQRPIVALTAPHGRLSLRERTPFRGAKG